MEVAYHPPACNRGGGTKRDGDRRFRRRASPVNFAKQSHKLVYGAVRGNACGEYKTIQVLKSVTSSIFSESSSGAAHQSLQEHIRLRDLPPLLATQLLSQGPVDDRETLHLCISVRIYCNGLVVRVSRQPQWPLQLSSIGRF